MPRRAQRILGGLVATVAIGALAAPVAPASAGGATAPPVSGGPGGSEYGAVLASSGRPVAAHFALAPARVVAGKGLPRIRLRFEEAGVPRVRARIVLRPLGGGRPVRVVLGGVRTGRTLRPAWPAGTVLAPGRYRVLVHATDPAGHALRRRAPHPGRTALTVVAPRPTRRPTPPTPAEAPAPVVVPPPVAASPASPAGTFPVVGTHRYGDGFGVGRIGHSHQGVDVFGAEGLPIVAPLAGTVRFTDYQAAAAGEYVVLHASSGADFFFAHCVRHSTVVAAGQVVTAGQPLCSLGDTGDAHGAHLHFELWPNGWRTGAKDSVPVDPLAQLKAWDG